jgi:hypothetical protein
MRNKVKTLLKDLENSAWDIQSVWESSRVYQDIRVIFSSFDLQTRLK